MPAIAMRPAIDGRLAPRKYTLLEPHSGQAVEAVLDAPTLTLVRHLVRSSGWQTWLWADAQGFGYVSTKFGRKRFAQTLLPPNDRAADYLKRMGEPNGN